MALNTATKGGYTASNAKCLKDLKALMESMRVVRAANVSACTGFVNEVYTGRMSIKDFEDYKDGKLGNYCDARCACDARTPCSCNARCSCDARCACDSRTPCPENLYCNCVSRVQGNPGMGSVCGSRTAETACSGYGPLCTCNTDDSGSGCPCNSLTYPCTCVSRTAVPACQCNTELIPGSPACLCNVRTTG